MGRVHTGTQISKLLEQMFGEGNASLILRNRGPQPLSAICEQPRTAGQGHENMQVGSGYVQRVQIHTPAKVQSPLEPCALGTTRKVQSKGSP